MKVSMKRILCWTLSCAILSSAAMPAFADDTLDRSEESLLIEMVEEESLDSVAEISEGIVTEEQDDTLPVESSVEEVLPVSEEITELEETVDETEEVAESPIQEETVGESIEEVITEVEQAELESAVVSEENEEDPLPEEISAPVEAEPTEELSSLRAEQAVLEEPESPIEEIIDAAISIKEDEKIEEVSEDTAVDGITIQVLNSDNTVAFTSSSFEFGDAYDGIQDALYYIKNHATDANPMTVKLPAGTYFINRNLKIYSNTTLDLSSGAVLKRSGTTTLLRFGATDDTAYGYEGYKNINIIGSADKYGTLDGNGLNKSIVHFAHAQNIEFRYIHFTNIAKAHHMEFAASKDVVIQDCLFDGMDSTGASASTNYEAVQFDILNAAHFSGSNAYDNTVNEGITVTNCVFDGVNRGIGTHSAEVGRYFKNIEITDNTFKNVFGFAIVATNFIDANISNNTIENCGSGIWFRHMIPNYKNYYPGTPETVVQNANSKICNNKISVVDTEHFVNYRFGVNLYGEKLATTAKNEDNEEIPAGDYRLSGVTITGNVITTTSDIFTNSEGKKTQGFHGIKLAGVTDSTINENSIVFNTTSSSASGVVTTDIGDGICLESCSNNTISNNIISNSETSTAMEHGINIRDCHDEIIANNTVQNSHGNGIYLRSSDGTTVKPETSIEGNTIQDSGKHGIYAYYGAADKISDNTIQKVNNKYSSQRGICIYGDDAKIEGDGIVNNTIANCQEYGIYVSTDATVSNISSNTITQNKKDSIGINLTESTFVSKVQSNTIGGKMKSAIRVLNLKKNLSVSSNKITTKNTSKEKFEPIIIKGSTKYTATCSKNTITGNKTGYGIQLQSGKGKLESNTIKSCTYPIYVKGTGTAVEVIGGSFSKNTKNTVKVGKKTYSVAKTSLSAANVSGKKVKSTWKKLSGMTAYQLQQSLKSKSGFKKIYEGKTTTYTKTKLSKGKTYYYRVRGLVKNGKVTVYSNWSSVTKGIKVTK